MNNHKFRAWDREKKRMSKPFGLFCGALEWSDGDIEMPMQFAVAQRDRIEFMQWSGILDQDDTPIYAGDLVGYKDTGKLVGEVVFKNGAFWIREKCGEAAREFLINDNPSGDYSKQIVVMGNVYKNGLATPTKNSDDKHPFLAAGLAIALIGVLTLAHNQYQNSPS